MKKKLLAVLLAGVLTVGTVGVPQLALTASAETVVEGAGEWETRENEDGTVTILQYNGDDTDVTIPDKFGEKSVTTIAIGAFSDCENLSTVIIPDSVTTIKDGAFSTCENLTKVTIPKSVTSIGETPFGFCTSLETIEIDKENTIFSFENGALIDNNTHTLIQYLCGRKDKEFSVPEGVTTIGNDAFTYCTNLTKISIPKSVTNIGRIHSILFSLCFSLETIEVAPENPNYSSVDGVLFDKDKTKLIRYPERKAVDKYTVPDIVTVIGESAFDYSKDDFESLAEITIPASVTSIEAFAFRGCRNLSVTILNPEIEIGTDAFIWSVFDWNTNNYNHYGVKQINYPVTLAEWEELGLEIADETTVVCTDGTIEGKPDDKPSGGSSSSSSSGSTTTTPEPTEYTDDENETGVTASADEGVLPDGAKLNVTPVADSANENQFTYDISFTDADGNEIQPKGNVTVKVPVPEKFKDAEKVYVYRAETDGTYTDMKAEIKDSFVVFTTNHFSKYIVTTEVLTKTETPAPETPKPTDTTPADTTTNPPTGVAIGLVPVILAGAVVIVSAKKRK